MELFRSTDLHLPSAQHRSVDLAEFLYLTASAGMTGAGHHLFSMGFFFSLYFKI